jgi:nitroimidazol reductase NimA-like FMN-containing flavoprotein (pyridoxamine 5'-phosphate oxidase superfamily)
MSAFTDLEIEYMAGQRLGRIATVGADGQPHVVPTSFRYNADEDTIVRIRPARIIAFGIDPGDSANARSVG